MEDTQARSIARREALVKLAAATVAAAAASVVPIGADEQHPRGHDDREHPDHQCLPRGEAVVVFRLRTRDTRSCRACRIHHRYMIFISHARADRNRAHPGCNCPITNEKLPKEVFRRIFLDSRAIRVGVVDLRKLRTGEGSRRGKRRGGPPSKRHAVGGKRTA
jgi:hypothetical protein